MRASELPPYITPAISSEYIHHRMILFENLSDFYRISNCPEFSPGIPPGVPAPEILLGIPTWIQSRFFGVLK